MIESSGKQISQTLWNELFSSLCSIIMSDPPLDSFLNLCLQCCSNLLHYSSITSYLQQDIVPLQSLCYKLLIPRQFPTSTVEFKICSLSFHILSFFLQHSVIQDPSFYSLCDRQSSLLLEKITELLLESEQDRAARFIANCFQLERTVHSLVPFTIEDVKDICLCFRWICEWKGDISVTNEVLSTLRVFFKSNWFDASDSLVTETLPFLEWIRNRIHDRKCFVETLRVLFVCLFNFLDGSSLY